MEIDNQNKWNCPSTMPPEKHIVFVSLCNRIVFVHFRFIFIFTTAVGVILWLPEATFEKMLLLPLRRGLIRPIRSSFDSDYSASAR